MSVGPKRLIAYAKSLRSVKVTNNINNMVNNAIKITLSLKK